MTSAVKIQNPVLALRLRYILAITLLALLVVGNLIILQLAYKSAEFDSRIVNLAGRQRMLSQQITKDVFGLARSENKAQQESYLGELSIALPLWEKSHLGLQVGDLELGLPGKNTPDIQRLFSRIGPSFDKIISSAKSIYEMYRSGNIDIEAQQKSLIEIRESEELFLPGMDKIVFQYDAESRDRLTFNQWLNLVLALLTLLVLILEAFLIFRPLEKVVGQSIQKIVDNEGNLKQLFDVAPQVLFLVEPHTFKILRLNLKAQEATGLDFDLAIGRQLKEFLGPRSLDILTKLEPGTAIESLDPQEVEIRDVKGVSRGMIMSGSRIHFQGRELYLLGFTDNSRQKEKVNWLEKLATTDELTGMLNRRTGMLYLSKDFDNAKRLNLELVLCFIDIDGLKTVNDSHGHDKGDMLISNVSQALISSIRFGDIIFRYGGDEFVMVIRYCKMEDAHKVMTRVDQALEKLNESEIFPFEHKISYGLASYAPEKFSDLESFIRYTDGLMYDQKREKKNKS